MNYGPSLPLRRNAVSGYEMITETKELVKFHLKNLLLTSPGEKISNPAYGVGIKRYLFEQLTEGNANVLKDKVTAQINTNLGYLTVLGINVLRNDDRNSLNIQINYTIDNLNIRDVLNIEVIPG